MILPGVLSGVHIFFPDPWRKKRHFKRRIIQPDFVALVARKLAPGGYVHCATDWEDYARQMRDVMSDAEDFAPAFEGDWAPRFDGRIMTAFERKGIAKGREIRDLSYRRKGRAAAPTADGA